MNLEYLSPNSEFCLVFQPVTQGKWSLIVSCNLFIIKPMITLVSHPINPSPQRFLTFPLCSPLSSFHLLFTCPSFAHSSLTVLVSSTSPLSLPLSQAQHRSSCQKKKKSLNFFSPTLTQPSQALGVIQQPQQTKDVTPWERRSLPGREKVYMGR